MTVPRRVVVALSHARVARVVLAVAMVLVLAVAPAVLEPVLPAGALAAHATSHRAMPPGDTPPGDTSPGDTPPDVVLQAAPGIDGPAAAARPVVELTLTGVETVVGPDSGRVTLVARIENTGSQPVTDVVARLTAYGRLTTRSAYEVALEAGPAALEGGAGTVVGREQLAVVDVPAGAVRYVSVSATPLELGVPPDVAAVRPLQLELIGRAGAQGDAVAVADVTTSLVVVGAPVDNPVRTGLGVALPSPVGPGEQLTTAGITELIDLVAAVGRLPVPAALAVDPVLPDQLDALAGGEPFGPDALRGSAPLSDGDDGGDSEDDRGDDSEAAAAAADLRSALTATPAAPVERLAVPTARQDLVALHRGGLTSAARHAVERGTSGPGDPVTTPTGGPVLVPPAGLNAATAAGVVAASGVGGVVLDADRVAPPPDTAGAGPGTPSAVRTLGAVPGGLTALVPDPWMQPVVDDPAALDPAAVQRVLGASALVWLERPGGGNPRGLFLLVGGTGVRAPIAVEPPAGDRVAPVAGMRALADALASAPWLEPSSLTDVLAEVPGEPGALAYPAPAVAAELPPAYVDRLAGAWEEVDALAGVLAPSEVSLAALGRGLLVAGSTAWRDDLAAGRERIADVTATVDELFSAVEVRRQPTVTFTDAEGQLPVLVANNAPVPVTVRVRLSSRRLAFADNDREVTLQPETVSTVVFETTARTPGGTTPVVVEVTDPAGDRVLAEGSVVVRITAYPLLAIVLLVGAGVVLAAWAVREWRRRGSRTPTARRPGS